MQAGFGEVVITPPMGTGMAGYFAERLAEGIKDDLHSRALVVSQGDTHVAVAVTDLIAMLPEDIQAVKQQVQARVGIPESHVLIAASHTHTGPVVHRRPGFRRDEEYMKTWARLTAGAIEIAFRDRVEVTLGVGRGSLPGVSFNRRFFMKNGYAHTNPGTGNPDIVKPAGPVDTDVTVLRFDGPDGVPVGVLAHFGCHCDTVGGKLFSADWVGVAAEKIRCAMQPKGSARPFGVVVVNGASGDINQFNVSDPGRPRRWPGYTEEIGLGLAGETVRVAVSLSPEACDHVGAASTEVALERMPLAEFLEKSHQALNDPKVGRMERRVAEVNPEWAEYHGSQPDSFMQEVICLRIGPALITSGPGEMFTQLGIDFKEAFPNTFGMVANLSNGYLGYVPTAKAYEEGGYEPRSTRLCPGTGEAIIEAGIALGKQLMGER